MGFGGVESTNEVGGGDQSSLVLSVVRVSIRGQPSQAHF